MFLLRLHFRIIILGMSATTWSEQLAVFFLDNVATHEFIELPKRPLDQAQQARSPKLTTYRMYLLDEITTFRRGCNVVVDWINKAKQDTETYLAIMVTYRGLD